MDQGSILVMPVQLSAYYDHTRYTGPGDVMLPDDTLTIICFKIKRHILV